MPNPSFGGKPSVLRCSRCGTFVDWEEARLQIVCGCRARLDLPPVLVRDVTDADRNVVLALFNRDFGRTRLVAFGEELHLDDMPAIVADLDGEVAGALAYRVREDTLQIVALATDPTWQRSGVGGYLLAKAELMARREGRTRLEVATTNDNLPALYFYQRKGYAISRVEPGAVPAHFGQAPSIGFGGIPIRDEIRLTKQI